MLYYSPSCTGTVCIVYVPPWLVLLILLQDCPYLVLSLSDCHGWKDFGWQKTDKALAADWVIHHLSDPIRNKVPTKVEKLRVASGIILQLQFMQILVLWIKWLTCMPFLACIHKQGAAGVLQEFSSSNRLKCPQNIRMATVSWLVFHLASLLIFIGSGNTVPLESKNRLCHFSFNSNVQPCVSLENTIQYESF